MCGIIAVINGSLTPAHVDMLKHRGPDQYGMYENDKISMGHTRLAIVNPHTGSQPIITGDWIVTVNGEIYNAPRSKHTDCMYIVDMLRMHGMLAPKYLDGVFSFVAYNIKTDDIIVARDPIGVTPLYWGFAGESIWIASELKALGHCEVVDNFPPGHVFQMPEVLARYTDAYIYPTMRTDEEKLVDLVYRACQKRLMCDVPWGVFLSGGLDSSIIASVIVKMCTPPEGYPTVHTFSVGLHDSPDLEVARKVAEELGTVHHELIYTVDQGLEMIESTVHAVETYDTTTIRASVPMKLLANFVKRHGIKMVLSGEGADELFAGYAYNKHAPSAEDLWSESVYKVENLFAFDCMRANKACMSEGVECRVPFLDKELVDWAMNRVHPGQKMWTGQEKRLLREAFVGIVPEVARTRTKAQFSDAVGSRWIQACRKLEPSEVGHYSDIFENFFPDRENCVVHDEESVACSSNLASEWMDAKPDPSGSIMYKNVENEEKEL